MYFADIDLDIYSVPQNVPAIGHPAKGQISEYRHHFGKIECARIQP
jgi:hypothetical protein